MMLNEFRVRKMTNGTSAELFTRLIYNLIDERIESKIKEFFDSKESAKISEMKRFCSTAELADILGVKPDTIRNRTQKGKYTPIIEGNKNLYDLEKIRELHPDLVESYLKRTLLS